MSDRLAMIKSFAARGKASREAADAGVEFDTFENVRVGRIISPSGYFSMDPDPDDAYARGFVWFQEQLEARGASFRGYMQRMDPMHVYSVRCNRDKSTGKSRYVTRVMSATRLPLDLGLLRSMAVMFGHVTESVAIRDTASLSAAAKAGGCGAILREVGGFPWYEKMERAVPLYFSQWYVDELCRVSDARVGPAYKRASIRSLSIDDVCSLARIAAKEPWRLCFWWIHGLPLVEELSADEAARIARTFASPLDGAMRTAAIAYSGRPFGDARDRGDSYVSQEEFKRCVPDCSVRDALYKAGIVTVVPDRAGGGVPEFQVYAEGDRRCEAEIARRFQAIATDHPDDVTVFPERCCWPWSDPDAHPLTDEQASAVRAALATRMFVCDGKPGTGKTSHVIRSIVSAFARGSAIGVAPTGAAAKKLHDSVGTGVTAHKVIDAWRRNGADHMYAERSVLILEEASMISIRLLRVLLIALGDSLRRVYVFGDRRQMAPPGGGPSVIRAMIDRYGGTPMAAQLTRSMRVADETGEFIRDLDRICDYNDGKRVAAADHPPELELEWSDTPDSRRPFVFIRRGSTEAETVSIIRDALVRSGLDPDESKEYQIVVHTNDLRRSLGRAWYVAGSFAKEVPGFREHEFRVGERVMFLENNYGVSPKGSEFKSDEIMNGTVGVISAAFDEDLLGKDRALFPLNDTGAPRSTPSSMRWIRIAPPVDALVSLDAYRAENVVRSQPATVAKMQGQETEVVIVYVDQIDESRGTTYSRRELYTACSRGKRRCMVVGGAIPGSRCDGLTPCPDPDFIKIVRGTSRSAERTSFWKAFRTFEDIGEDAKASPIVSHSRDGAGSKRDAEDDGDDAPSAKRKGPHCVRPDT